MIDELDIVALIHPITVPNADGDGSVCLEAGEHGTVVMVYGDHAAYEVEFMESDESPYTKALVTLRPDQVQLVWKALTNAEVPAD
jgi:hypothetical protein